MRLHRNPKERAEDARGHGVSAEPEERVSAAELCAIRRHAGLRVALRHVQRRLEPVEPDPDERAIDDAVAHVVELGAQQPEDHDTPIALAISSTIGAEIGAASSIAASGPRTCVTTGC